MAASTPDASATDAPVSLNKPTADDSVQRWIDAIDRAEKDKKRAEWETRCRKITRRYKDERSETKEITSVRQFALLWANQQTLQPVVYARCPRPEVNRRFKDEDPVGRVSSEVLERALAYTLDAYDFDGVMKLCRDDFLLYARGQAWVRYVPHMKSVQTPVTPVQPAAEANAPGVKPSPAPPEQGDAASEGPEVSDDVSAYQDAEGKTYDPKDVQHADDIGPHIVEDVLDYEETLCDHVHYDDFLHPSIRTWPEVPWVGRRAFMTRDELIDRFGSKLGKVIPLDWKEDGEKRDSGTMAGEQPDDKAAIYEIWDKRKRKVCWISKGHPSEYLDERDDPLGLTDFFPCPRPMQGTTSSDTFIPVPDYVFYQDQAEEIDDLTGKIGRLEKGLKMMGFYAGQSGLDLSALMGEGENRLVPIADWSTLKGDGGIKGLIEWWPLDVVIDTLEAMVKLRAQLIQDVFQITGIADILRGASDPGETATAQGIKANWGAVRVRDKQKELSRFARDLIRIMGQIIASRFSTETLKKMTDMQMLDTVKQKQQIEQQIQAQQAMAQQAAQAQQAQQMAQSGPGAPAPQGGPPGPANGPAPPQPQGGPPPHQMQPGAGPPQAAGGAPGSPAGPPAGGAPPIPLKLQRMLANPTWEEVGQLLQDEASRQFRIDVETDSTIEPDEQQDKAAAIEFVDTVSGFVQRAASAPPQMAPILGEVLKFLVRRYRAGRELEDLIDKVADEIANAPPPPPAGKGADPAAMIAAQARMTVAQTGVHKEQREAVDSQAHLQLDAGKLNLDWYAEQHDPRKEFIDIGARP